MTLLNTETRMRSLLLLHSERDEETGCLCYLHRWDHDGYPVIESNGKKFVVGRIALKVFCGIDAKFVCHKHKTCYRCCIEPSHLLGFQTRGEMRRGLVAAQGSPNRKVPEWAREEIRRLYRTGQYTYANLTEKFGVSNGGIYYIVNEKKKRRTVARPAPLTLPLSPTGQAP